MFVCICNAVSDREIRALAAEGVTTLDELRLRTGCSDCCGQCAEEAEAVLASASSPRQGATILPVLQPQGA